MPVAWTIKGESGKSFTDSTVTLASQSITSAVCQFRSLEADTLTLDYEVANYASHTTFPELRQSVTLFRDGTRFFTGTVTSVSPRVTSESQSVRVVVSGPWWWLERIPMTSSQVDGEGNNAARPMYSFGTFAAGADMAANLSGAIDRAISLGAPMLKGSIASSFTVPRITLSQQTCGGVISELVRLIPDTMVWFDYSLSSTDDPTIKIERRGAASSSMFTIAPNLITNGDFVSDISGWTKSGDAASTIEWDNGRLKVNAATNYDGAVQSVSGLVSGKAYKFSADYEFGTATQLQIRAGSEPSTDLSSPSSGTAVNYFTASSATMSIYIRTGGSTGTMFFDNISIVQVPSVPSGSDSVSTDLTTIDIKPLIELEVSQVQVPYVTRAATGETQYVTQDSGTASTGKVEILPVSGPELVDFLPNDQLDTLKIAASYAGDLTGLAEAVKAMVYPGWADLSSTYGSTEGSQWGLDVTDTFINGGSIPIVVERNLSAANTGSSSSSGSTSQTFPAGTTAFAQTSFSSFSGKKFVRFEDDQDPPQWAIDDYSMVQYTPAVISWFDGNDTASNFNQDRRLDLLNIVQWTYSRGSTNNTGIEIPSAPTYLFGIWTPTNDEVKLWMMNTSDIPADNTLIRAADFTFAAPPANFAANLLAAQNYIPHEGTIGLSSADSGATRYRGTKVNVSGSLSTLASMGALVESETVNVSEGTTEIELGQPPRLDFLEFSSRVRRTPQDNTNYIQVEPNWNASAKAYFDKCEDVDSFTWSTLQKSAIHTFFNALLTMGDSSTDLTSDIKALHFYGANSAVCLRNAMAPATVYASWNSAPVSGDFADGRLDTDGLDGTFGRTQAELGLATKQQGGFIAVTNVPRATMWWMNAYSSSTRNYQLKQDTGELAGRFSYSVIAKGQNEAGSTITDPARNGIFVSSRQGNLVTCVNRTNSNGRLTNTHSRTQNAGTSTNDISMILGSGSYNVQSHLSVMGITYGLSTAETERLSDALYDLAIGVGHTAIGST